MSRVKYNHHHIEHSFFCKHGEVITEVDVATKTIEGNYSSQAETPCEYYGYTEILSQVIRACWLIDPEDSVTPFMPNVVLDKDEKDRYHEELNSYIERCV